MSQRSNVMSLEDFKASVKQANAQPDADTYTVVSNILSNEGYHVEDPYDGMPDGPRDPDWPWLPNTEWILCDDNNQALEEYAFAAKLDRDSIWRNFVNETILHST